MLVRYTLGDESNDGHGRSKTYLIELGTDSRGKEILSDQCEDLYQNLTKKLDGFNFCKNVFADYEDNALPKDISELILDKLGIDVTDEKFEFDICEEEDTIYALGPDEAIRLLIEMINKANDTNLRIVEDPDIPEIEFSKHDNYGYGLFCG